MDIQLNFINQSNDANNSEVVIFQKNALPSAQEVAVAWQVIRYCGRGDHHPFRFPMATTVGASDSWGNFTPTLAAEPGQRFQMQRTASGDQLVPAGPANFAEEIELANELESGAINANVYKDGKLFATRTEVAPGQMAAFQFKPSIWIGVASQVEEGQVLDTAIVSEVNTELSLEGIASADIVMTGGGTGPDAAPFQFTLQNVVMA